MGGGGTGEVGLLRKGWLVWLVWLVTATHCHPLPPTAHCPLVNLVADVWTAPGLACRACAWVRMQAGHSNHNGAGPRRGRFHQTSAPRN
jgi:hypothetical protein